MKQDHYIFALVGVGAVIVLYMLWRENAAASAAPQESGAVIPETSAPSYPNAQPIQLGNIVINDGTINNGQSSAPAPATQTYNAPPVLSNPFQPVKVGTALSSCGCDDDDCDQAGTPVTQQTIPQPVLKAAVSNLQSYVVKVGGTITGGDLAA